MKSIMLGRVLSLIACIMDIIIGSCCILFSIIMFCFSGGDSVGIVFVLVGVISIPITVISALYHFRNAIGKGSFSIDPLEDRLLNYKHEDITKGISNSSFCPYCGTKVMDNFEYCSRCGKKLP